MTDYVVTFCLLTCDLLIFQVTLTELTELFWLLLYALIWSI